MVQRDQWDTYWGPKKIYLLVRDIDDATMADLVDAVGGVVVLQPVDEARRDAQAVFAQEQSARAHNG